MLKTYYFSDEESEAQGRALTQPRSQKWHRAELDWGLSSPSLAEQPFSGRTGLALTDHNLTQSHPFTASYKQHQVVEKTTMGHLDFKGSPWFSLVKKFLVSQSPLMWIGLQNQVRLKQDTHVHYQLWSDDPEDLRTQGRNHTYWVISDKAFESALWPAFPNTQAELSDSQCRERIIFLGKHFRFLYKHLTNLVIFKMCSKAHCSH